MSLLKHSYSNWPRSHASLLHNALDLKKRPSDLDDNIKKRELPGKSLYPLSRLSEEAEELQIYTD